MFANLLSKMLMIIRLNLTGEVQTLLITIKFVGAKGEVKIAQWIRGSNTVWTSALDNSSSMSYGKFNGHSKAWWRAFIRIWYSLGL